MSPRGSIATDSVKTMPAPPTAREHRCWKCQSPGVPFSAEYWHIGDIVMRLRTRTERKSIGRKMCGVRSR